MNQTQLLKAIARAQSYYIGRATQRDVFDYLLAQLLEVTGSEYGFIGEVLHADKGSPYLKTHAITNIAWDEATRRFYDDNAPKGMEFHNLDTLFGRVMATGQTVIANDPYHDPRRGGLPPGHPALNAFLGIPFFGNEGMVGMVGIANRAGGYDQELVEFLQPLLGTCAGLIEAYRRNAQAQRFQETLNQKQALLNKAQQLARIGSWELDLTTNALRWSDEIFRIFEIDPARFGASYEAFIDTVHPDDRELVNTAYTQSLRDRSPYNIVHRLQMRDGRVKHVREHCETEFGADGRPLRSLGTVQDVTDQRLAQEALQRSEAFSRAISETAPDGIFAIDERGVIQSCNPAAERIFGFTRGEMIGRNVKMLMPEPQRSEHDGYLANYCAGGPAKVIGIGREVTAQRKDGSLFPLDLAVGEMQVGGRRYFTGIVRDITERKRMERIKDEFISIVSHELRTPLTSIRGALGLLAGNASHETPDQTQSLLQIALRNSEHLTHLINDLLDLQKIEAGKMDFDIRCQPIRPIVEAALEEALGLQQQYRVQFILTESLADARVQVDSARLAQVLANLLSNAAKFSPPDAPVELAVTRSDAGIQVSVRDHGPGVAEEFRDHTFEKFSQADASDSRQKGGTGLGLAICKSIIEQMEGAIGYDSMPGAGATFFFTLPECRPAETRQ